MARNYDSEYKNYHARPEQKKRRAKRNAARKMVEKAKGKSFLRGKDIAHSDNNPNNNSKKNLKVQEKSKNRSFPRTKTARRKSS